MPSGLSILWTFHEPLGQVAAARARFCRGPSAHQASTIRFSLLERCFRGRSGPGELAAPAKPDLCSTESFRHRARKPVMGLLDDGFEN